ncbi:MAG TPA: hypothetical protein VJQ09_05690, partial [Candidatus Limnocylindria bacterium]|nr:hypothetical protein [Candidatus Limnocylindria bacterium]
MSPRRAWRDLGLASLAFAVQAAIVSPLFGGPLTRWRGSIESAFITDVRFIAERFPHLSWNPLWYLGFPFELFYTPLLQLAAALLSPVAGGAAPAYRIVAAIGYALGPPALFVLARRLAMPREAALLAAAIFALGPSAALLLPGLLGDAQNFTGSSLPAPWRLVALVEYGEGPHVLGLSLLLFAAAALQSYLAGGRRAAYWSAVGLFVAVALTNLIALLGGAIFAVGVAFAIPGRRERVERALKVGALAGLLSLSWYSPGFIRAVVGFSAPGGEGGGSAYLALPIVAAVVALGVRRLRPSQAVAVAAFVALVCGAILAAWYVGHVPLAPQPIRYALELDAAFAILVAAGAAWLARRTRLSPGRQPLAFGAVIALVLLASGPSWIAARESIAPDPGSDRWSEREVALWLRDHLGSGERAYLSGSHSFWVDVFADVPQIRGGVDFAATDPWWAHATYQINTGSDADVSILWLRAFGVRFAVVTGPESKDIYRDFAKPAMFDGKLALAMTLQGTRLYRVEDVHASAVLANADESPAPPRDALDRGALNAYLGWLARTPAGTSANVTQRALELWQGEVSAPAVTVDVAIPIAYDEGWHAYLEDLDHPHYESLPAPTHPDAVGLLAVRVPAGHFQLHVEHRLHRDHLLSLAIVFAALGALGLWWSVRRARVLPLAAPAAVGVATILFAGALGVIGGFPKGTDALMHLTRLKFVSDWFPHHNWLYAWSAGMPAFTTYPALPYLASLPFVRIFGPEPMLGALAFLAALALGLGVYGHLRERGVALSTALLAALIATTSLATWQWIVQAGAYARVIAVGLGALSWWTHAR